MVGCSKLVGMVTTVVTYMLAMVEDPSIATDGEAEGE